MLYACPNTKLENKGGYLRLLCNDIETTAPTDKFQFICSIGLDYLLSCRSTFVLAQCKCHKEALTTFDSRLQ